MEVGYSQALLLELPDQKDGLFGRHKCYQGIHLRRFVLQNLGGEIIGADVEGFVNGKLEPRCLCSCPEARCRSPARPGYPRPATAGSSAADASGSFFQISKGAIAARPVSVKISDTYLKFSFSTKSSQLVAIE